MIFCAGELIPDRSASSVFKVTAASKRRDRGDQPRSFAFPRRLLPDLGCGRLTARETREIRKKAQTRNPKEDQAALFLSDFVLLFSFGFPASGAVLEQPSSRRVQR